MMLDWSITKWIAENLPCLSVSNFGIKFQQSLKMRASSFTILREIIHRPRPSPSPSPVLLPCVVTTQLGPRSRISFRCSGGDEKKVSSRQTRIQQIMEEAEERATSADTGPIPQITLDHVTMSFARSGGAGGQNVNKVNTKVDMRFNVKNAYWLSDWIRERIIQMEKNRINKDGELVISSTKTRTQKGNIDDALEKLQTIIDAAAYVPPPPSQEQKKKIAKIAAIGEQKRLKNKKALSDKKASRRIRDSWD